MMRLAAAAALTMWAVLPSPAGPWRAVLDLEGAVLPFALEITGSGTALDGRLCNGRRCQPLSRVTVRGDSVELEIADYAATLSGRLHGDSLTGSYRNVGNRGPRTIPFRAARGRWPATPGSQALVGRWDATFFSDFGSSPRVFELRNDTQGLEGTMISNTGDYGHFSGRVAGDSFALAHFDGSFVYLLTGMLHGDTLRGVFHAGLRTQTPVDRRAKHRDPAPQGADRDHHGRHHDAIPIRLSGSARSDGHRARPAIPRARWCWWTSSAAGAPRATTRRPGSCGSTGSITRAGSRSLGWPMR